MVDQIWFIFIPSLNEILILPLSIISYSGILSPIFLINEDVDNGIIYVFALLFSAPVTLFVSTIIVSPRFGCSPFESWGWKLLIISLFFLFLSLSSGIPCTPWLILVLLAFRPLTRVGVWFASFLVRLVFLCFLMVVWMVFAEFLEDSEQFMHMNKMTFEDLFPRNRT